MKYLLLSVLVVCVIGVMIPSVFGQQDLFGFQKQEASPLSEAYETLKDSIMIFFYGGSSIIPFLFLVCVFAIVLSWFAFRRSRKS
jgi:ABC-type glucose/galactose transport system permease subunit